MKWAATEQKEAQKDKATLDIVTLEAVLCAGDGKHEQKRQAQHTSTVTNSGVPLFDKDSPADGNGGQLQSISDLAHGDDGGAATEQAGTNLDEPLKKKAKSDKASASKDEGSGGKGAGTCREAIEAIGKKVDAKVHSYCYHQWDRKHVFLLNLNLMLLLNPTTLFYFNLSNDQLAKDKYAGIVSNWAKNVPKGQGKGGSTKSTSLKTLSSNSNARSAPTSAPTSVSSGKIKGHDSTTSNSQSNNNDVAITFSGLDDDDETPEREAALSSPTKEGKRLTSAGIVKIEQMPTPMKQEKPPWNRWLRVMVPTFLRHLGGYSNIWTVPDEVLLKMMSELLSVVYLDQDYDIQINCPVFHKLQQHTYNYRSGFGSAGLAVSR
ncbi:hypothetical protein BJV74DRAFT_888354 [Russula compacta]|nr:hypothetical protein BJV74DRAFT_888354 [Russula compacta]